MIKPEVFHQAKINGVLQRAAGMPAIWLFPKRPSERLAIRRRISYPGELLSVAIMHRTRRRP